MKVAGITYSFSKKRILASFLNFVIAIVLTFLCDRFLSNVTYKKWVGYDSKYEQYTALSEEYKAKQDEYGIYIYDEENNRILASTITEEMRNNFSSDSRVIELKKEENSLRKNLMLLDLSSFGVSYLFTTLLINMVFSLFLRKYLSIGHVLTRQSFVRSSGELASKKRLLLFTFIRWLCLYPLGIASICLVPVAFMYQVIYNENSQTKLEKKFDLVCVLENEK